MTRRFPILAAIALLWTSGTTLAQTFDATQAYAPTELGGTWLACAGDDPAYARPDFDDSKWTLVDTSRSLHEYFPGPQRETLWYRLHVKVNPRQKGLALEEYSLSSIFAVYVNGEKLLQVGKFAPLVPYTMDDKPQVPIPSKDVEAGSFVIALRVHSSNREWTAPFPGLFPGNLVLGDAAALRDHNWLNILGSHMLFWLEILLSVSVCLVALALYTSQQRRREYLWIFLAGVTSTLFNFWLTIMMVRAVPQIVDFFTWPLETFTSIFWVLAYFAFLRIPIYRWIKIFLVVTITAATIRDVLYTLGWASSFHTEILAYPFNLLPAIAVVLLIQQMRRGNREAGILMFPILCEAVATYVAIFSSLLQLIPSLRETILDFTERFTSYSAGPFSFSMSELSPVLMWISMAVIIVRRSNHVSQQQTRLEGELEAAREVQQVILPEPVSAISGFRVDSVYKPAQQVGGDFFQVLPVEGEGLLLVLGDVAGKGVPAALMVAVLVGTIRTVARTTHDPARILAELNLQLLGRTSGGFSTCMAAYIDAEGLVKLANAGHLSPYLDGCEVAVPGALPLGIAEDPGYEICEFRMAPGSRLTLYSDGVVEAQNKKGELLGFDRSREISTLAAEEIAKTAADFGQEDDITVVVIERVLIMAAVG